jgi:phosphoglycerol transferase
MIRNGILAVGNVLIAIVLVVWMGVNLQVQDSDIEIQFVYEQDSAELLSEGEIQLYYASSHGEFTEDYCINLPIEYGAVNVSFGTIAADGFDFTTTRFRLDPLQETGNFSICEVNGLYKGRVVFSLSGEEFAEYTSEYVGCEYDSEKGVYTATSDDPYFCVSAQLFRNVRDACSTAAEYFYFISALVLYAICGVILYAIRKRKAPETLLQKHPTRYLAGHLAGLAVAALFLVLGLTANIGYSFLVDNFGDVTIGELLFHLKTNTDGANLSPFHILIKSLLFSYAEMAVALLMADMVTRKRKKNKGYFLWASLLGVLLAAKGLISMGIHFEVADYWNFIHAKSTLYEEYYVDAAETELNFPEEKRNLIYIFLESMETTYADENDGGGMDDVNYIPELTALAEDNICFSGGSGINGSYATNGATFTLGALVGQTSGVPINENLFSNEQLNSYFSDSVYLPGAWTLGDVLDAEGYNQEFMIGSDAAFAGRGAYFTGHGNYKVFDYYTAISEQKITSDYYVWWGYEDAKLFTYAKEEILALAGQDEPFNFTMLTVDTHFTNGYVCDACTGEYGLQYSNVMVCSSRQVAAFVEWIKEQDFYENTTIIISGDHLTMDSAYIRNAGAEFADRKVYLAIINPAEGCEDSENARLYTTLDLYPTTLASIGVSIEGNRLGLGTNLFSDTPTLAEELGFDYLNDELLKNSDLYLELMD